MVIGDILDDEGKALADELGDAARYVHLDVTQPDQWKAAVSTAADEFGQLDVLVNNAGIVDGSHSAVRPHAVAENTRRQPHRHIPGHPGGRRSDDRRRRWLDDQCLLD